MLKEKYETPIQFIADRGAKISLLFNVYLTENDPDYDDFQVKHAIPSKSLINKEGIIVWSYLGSREVRPSMETLIEAIEKYL